MQQCFYGKVTSFRKNSNLVLIPNHTLTVQCWQIKKVKKQRYLECCSCKPDHTANLHDGRNTTIKLICTWSITVITYTRWITWLCTELTIERHNSGCCQRAPQRSSSSGAQRLVTVRTGITVTINTKHSGHVVRTYVTISARVIFCIGTNSWVY